ncbi:MAG: Conserved repeat domain-containing protein [uncultured Thiotrichaceae bacterium]|uniref:Conserved repeat domain-containing protein n=1 Tax=uncultured Thiotrichaceae bacterium TaxID=298394 RepID=A0A6S6UAH3_9GAMM|nr:MAG: Conserved repeat domain-containing protein [uncultured Thiotrichaceae bacterium]
MIKKTRASNALLLTFCAVGVLVASNPAWADADLNNCALVTGTEESDADSAPNNITQADLLAAYVADPDYVSQDDEDCAKINVVSIFDYGDAPDSYGTLEASGGAKHEIIPKLSLGALVDEEDGTLTNAEANADDNNGDSDEDGYTVTTMTEGQDLDWDVLVTNETGSSANLVCWIDYNGDGAFATDGSESGSAVVASLAGPQTITVGMPPVPAGAVADNLDRVTIDSSDSYTRCRLSTDSALTELAPAGLMADGEVEDRKVTFVDAPVFDLALRKTVTNPSAPVKAGDTVSFNIEVINQGTISATGVVVTDYIPLGMELDPADANWAQTPADAANPTGPQIATLITPISVAAGQPYAPVLTISLRVLADVVAGDLTNTAEISVALDADGNAVVDRDSIPNADNTDDGVVSDDTIDNTGLDQDDHDIAVVSIAPTVDVDLAKDVFEADGTTPATSVRRGDTLIYVLTVANAGPDDATNVAVTDLLPAGLTYVSDDSVGATYVPASGLWTIGDLANGASMSLRITVTVD